jgi:predicted TIM-barrel fold metal-dependent hydrolase
VIVDAHVHILPDRLRENPAAVMADPWFAACHRSPAAVLAGPDDLLAAMDAAQVDRAVCFTWPFRDPGLCAEGNDWLVAVVRNHADRLVGFGCVNPADPGAATEARRCATLGLQGLGELNADAQGWALEDDAVLAPLVAACVDTGLPWTLHCSEPLGHDYPGKGTAIPSRVAGLAARHEDLRIIAAHLGGGLPLYAYMPEVREACRRNLWFDTAAQPFLYDAGVYTALVALVGADRLMLGSDYPLLAVPRYRAAIETALDAADADAVLGGTAARLLGLT